MQRKKGHTLKAMNSSGILYIEHILYSVDVAESRYQGFAAEKIQKKGFITGYWGEVVTD